MAPNAGCQPAVVYRPRTPHDSPVYKVVSRHFDEFERVYPEQFEKTYGFWRPIVRESIEKYVKCGDLKEGFGRVHCFDCGRDYFLPFSCKQRCCCSSCDTKRAIVFGMHLTDEVVEKVPHRQWVLSIPKRFRIFVRFDRSLLGKLCARAYETVREFLTSELDDDTAVPGMVAICQSFGDLLNWNTHIHALCSDGLFLPSGTFVPMKNADTTAVVDIWKEKVFSLLLAEKKITPDVVESMRQWKHSGFSVDSSVCIDKEDTDALRRVAQYIGRSPLSLSRVVALTEDGSLIYRATHSRCLPFPVPADEELSSGSPRNFQIFSPFEFLAEFTAHIRVSSTNTSICFITTATTRTRTEAYG